MNSSNNNLIIGKVCICLNEVDSTNSYARECLAKSKPSEGTVIVARYQTGGRGQFGKSWESEPGRNITFSIVLYPVFLRARQAHSLNQAVCLGLKDFVESLNIEVQIKWPNDIYHYDKKLAGILIENGLMGEKLDYSIIGIGMNVNQTKFSPELPNPVSLKMIAGKEFELEKLINDVCGFVETRYRQLKKGQWKEIKKDFEKALYGLGQRRMFEMNDELLEGIISGLDDEGQLILTINGNPRAFSGGIAYR